MNRIRTAATAVALLALMLLAVGCVSNPADAEMSENPDVWGYVASADSAQLEVTEVQQGATELTIDRVLAPGAAWIVVHLDDNGKPGMRVGIAPVKKGESTNVKVKLDEIGTEKVIVAIHADRGEKGEFDFDMMAPTMSPDRPYFVDEKELAKMVTVREFGVKADAGTAAIEVEDQPGETESLTVKRVLAPGGAWIVMHLDEDGAPGARVGLQQIPAGESTDVAVELYPLPLTDTLFAAVHADLGTAGIFEFDMMNKVNSPDQPYFVDGTEVAVPVKVR
ncbi:MAG: hypothetical protein U1E26_01480 [Coriobacteriia bacterium]|nr:hypothetical protein [Coriobacteriia bacterium]